MSLAIKYETLEDARMRLRNTVVLYRGAPVYVREVTPGDGNDIFRVKFDELPVLAKALAVKPRIGGLAAAAAAIEQVAEEDLKRKFISSKYFDIAPFRMGYVNRQEGTGAFYCSRMPNRQQKQGLGMENFQAVDNFGNYIDWHTFLSCKETPAMVANEYPSFTQAIAALNKSRAVAFSRDYCVVKDEIIPDLIFLYHKGQKVGMYTADIDRVRLGAKFNCLKESLQEMQLKVGVI